MIHKLWTDKRTIYAANLIRYPWLFCRFQLITNIQAAPSRNVYSVTRDGYISKPYIAFLYADTQIAVLKPFFAFAELSYETTITQVKSVVTCLSCTKQACWRRRPE
jgi:hypothetical protein